MPIQAETLIHTLDHFFRYVFTAVSQSGGFSTEKARCFLNLVVQSFDLFSHLNDGISPHSKSLIAITLTQLLGDDLECHIEEINRLLSMCCKEVKDEGSDNILYVYVDPIAKKQWNNLPTIIYEGINATIEKPTGYVLAWEVNDKKTKGEYECTFTLTSEGAISEDTVDKLSVNTDLQSNSVFMSYKEGGFVLKEQREAKLYDEIIIFNGKDGEELTQSKMNFLKASSVIPFLVSRLTFFAKQFNERPDFRLYVPLLAHLLWLSDKGDSDDTTKKLFAGMITCIHSEYGNSHNNIKKMWQYLMPRTRYNPEFRDEKKNAVASDDEIRNVLRKHYHGGIKEEKEKQILTKTEDQYNTYAFLIRMYWTTTELWIVYDNCHYSQEGFVTLERDGACGDRRVYLKFTGDNDVSIETKKEFDNSKIESNCIYRSYYYCDGE